MCQLDLRLTGAADSVEPFPIGIVCCHTEDRISVVLLVERLGQGPRREELIALLGLSRAEDLTTEEDPGWKLALQSLGTEWGHHPGRLPKLAQRHQA